MKLLRSNDRVLEIYDIGSRLMTISSVNLPVKVNGWKIVEDEIALATVRSLIDSDLYDVRSYRSDG